MSRDLDCIPESGTAETVVTTKLHGIFQDFQNVFVDGTGLSDKNGDIGKMSLPLVSPKVHLIRAVGYQPGVDLGIIQAWVGHLVPFDRLATGRQQRDERRFAGRRLCTKKRVRQTITLTNVNQSANELIMS